MSNVSFNANYGNYYLPTYVKDVENVAKYVYGTQVVPQKESVMEGAGGMLAFSGIIEGFNALSWFGNNKGNLPEAFKKGKDAVKAGTKTFVDTFSKGGWHNASIYKNAWMNYSANLVKESLPDFAKKAYSPEAKKLFNEAAKLAEKAASTPAKATELMNKANKTLAQAKVASAGAKNIYAGKGILGHIGNGFRRIGSGISKVTGLSKLTTAVNKFATKSPIVAKVLKVGKGAGIDLIITGGIELATQVVPTFKELGVAKGLKQLFKSSTTTIASAGGWAAGAAIGGAIGSVLPVAGTLVGSIIGGTLSMLGGAVVSGLATKGAKALVGENELDKQKAKDAQQLAKSNNTQAVQEVMITAAQRLKEEGVDSEENKIVAQSLNNLASTLPMETSEKQVQQNQPVQTVQTVQRPQVQQNVQAQPPKQDELTIQQQILLKNAEMNEQKLAQQLKQIQQSNMNYTNVTNPFA